MTDRFGHQAWHYFTLPHYQSCQSEKTQSTGGKTVERGWGSNWGSLVLCGQVQGARRVKREVRRAEGRTERDQEMVC